MKIYALICSRDKLGTSTRNELISYLSSLGVNIKLLVNQDSLFEAYSKTVNSIDYSDDDIFIFCHDDIEILNDRATFFNTLTSFTKPEKTGFIGVAGTKALNANGVWWHRDSQYSEKLRGIVFHGKSRSEMSPSYYGPPYSPVVCSDGLFLACRGKVLRDIDLSKPEEFPGEWDYYDIYYNLQAHQKGYINKVVPILIRHESIGQLAGRDSWHQNREALQKLYNLPIETSL